MNEQQKAVDAFLQENNIACAAHYVGETMRENTQSCDAWRVSFAAGKSRFETDYYTGLGHRKPVKGAENRIESKYPKSSIGYAAWQKAYVKPIAPYAADVLHSLILDSSAIDTSFDYWCSNYGYDADSISAFNAYQACCKTAKELRRVFTRAQLETLHELLEGIEP